MNSVRSQEYQIAIWLFFCAFTVFCMIVVGGATRLTQSGLSMVEWEPIMGIIPPLSLAEWQETLEKYRAYPEYQLINKGMSLEEFKSIFWWEYGHRVLGRAIGVIFALPLIYFWIRGYVKGVWKLKLAGLWLLGGMQGLMGWYMVKSGLVDVPHVSQYRLTAHLSLAFIIFGFMLWFAMDFWRGTKAHLTATDKYLLATTLSCVVIFIMMVTGGFVAGTKAGFIINTFPTMNGQWVPDGLAAMTPWWKNLFENQITIQFIHRALALIVLISVVYTFVQARHQAFKTNILPLVIMLGIQLGLGISALLLKVPVALGTAHQGGAALLFGAALWVAHTARKDGRE
jgi:cytochrome c oxidase assembly protein subunit 15